MTATDAILDQLNTYNGDNVWQDVVTGLDIDETKTGKLDPTYRSDVFALTDGTVIEYDYIAGRWAVTDPREDEQ